MLPAILNTKFSKILNFPTVILKNIIFTWKLFVLSSGIHAREWIAPATVTFMMNELITNSAAYQDSIDAIDFVFMPTVNPDGYQYSYVSLQKSCNELKNKLVRILQVIRHVLMNTGNYYASRLCKMLSYLKMVKEI